MSLSSQFKAPRGTASSVPSRVKPLFADASGNPIAVKPDLESQPTQEMMAESESIGESDDEMNSFDEDVVSEIIVQKTNEFISEFGEQLFKLTVQQWLTKREKKTRTSSAGTTPKKTKDGSGSDAPARKRKRL